VKLDGTSATYVLHEGDYQVCSRNMSFKLIDDNKDNIYLKISEKYNIKKMLEKVDGNLAIQGEIVGPGIQKNRLGLKDVDFYVFNVYDINKRQYVDFEMLKMFRDATGMKLVPIIEVFEFNHTIDELLEMARGFYQDTKNHREGMVIRPVDYFYSETLKGRTSFKVINNEFLLKEKE
jgi:RNA ligase (TIGR02306 family)